MTYRDYVDATSREREFWYFVRPSDVETLRVGVFTEREQTFRFEGPSARAPLRAKILRKATVGSILFETRLDALKYARDRALKNIRVFSNRVEQETEEAREIWKLIEKEGK